MLTHPQIVHFPIALLIAALLFDLIALFWKQHEMARAAFILLILGALSAVAAAISGADGAESYIRDPRFQAAIFDHEQAGEWLRNFYLVFVIVRSAVLFKTQLTRLILVFYLILHMVGAMLIVQAGDLGGKLVYEFGLGVKTTQQPLEGVSE